MIESDCSIDFWSDFLSEEAIDLLEVFDNDDWSNLTKEVMQMDVDSQVRIAETLSEVVTITGVGILLELLNNSDNEDVLEATIDSLNAISQLKGGLAVTEQQFNKIKEQSNKSNLINIPAKKLLSRVKIS